MTVNYSEYIHSSEWRKRADAAKRRAEYRCQVCNRSQDEIVLDAHHRTYERLGNELPNDITVLCHDCHSLFESRLKQNIPRAEGVVAKVVRSIKNMRKARQNGYLYCPKCNQWANGSTGCVWCGGPRYEKK